MLDFIVYAGSIKECDQIPAYLYLAKHISLMMLLINEKYPQLCTGSFMLNAEVVKSAMYMGRNAALIKIITSIPVSSHRVSSSSDICLHPVLHCPACPADLLGSPPVVPSLRSGSKNLVLQV